MQADTTQTYVRLAEQGAEQPGAVRFVRRCHLDAKVLMHHDDSMRTTLTLDDDVATQLREQAARQRLPFRQVVNAAIRLGLRAGTPPAQRTPFRTKARRLGLRPGIDPDKLGQLADELEAQEFRRKSAPARSAAASRGRGQQ